MSTAGGRSALAAHAADGHAGRMTCTPEPEEVPTRRRLAALGTEECRARLADAHIGRVVFVDGRGPVALPVNYGILDEDIVFRTAASSSLLASSYVDRVGFEIDEIDERRREGWSVLVTGSVRHVTDDDRARRRASARRGAVGRGRTHASTSASRCVPSPAVTWWSPRTHVDQAGNIQRVDLGFERHQPGLRPKNVSSTPRTRDRGAARSRPAPIAIPTRNTGSVRLRGRRTPRPPAAWSGQIGQRPRSSCTRTPCGATDDGAPCSATQLNDILIAHPPRTSWSVWTAPRPRDTGCAPAHRWLTEPSITPVKPPRPRLPTTRRSASRASSTKTRAGWPSTTRGCTGTEVDPSVPNPSSAWCSAALARVADCSRMGAW